MSCWRVTPSYEDERRNVRINAFSVRNHRTHLLLAVLQLSLLLLDLDNELGTDILFHGSHLLFELLLGENHLVVVHVVRGKQRFAFLRATNGRSAEVGVMGAVGGTDEVHHVAADGELAKEDEIAVFRCFDKHGTPAVVPAAALLALVLDRGVGTDDGKRNVGLLRCMVSLRWRKMASGRRKPTMRSEIVSGSSQYEFGYILMSLDWRSFSICAKT